MTYSSPYSRHVRRDRLSVNVVPEQSRDTEPQSPYLHWLFVENSEDDIYARLTDTNADGMDDIDGYSTAEAVIMKEVAAWLELCEHDDFWVAKGRHARKVRSGSNISILTTNNIRLFSPQPASFLRDGKLQTLLYPTILTVPLHSTRSSSLLRCNYLLPATRFLLQQVPMPFHSSSNEPAKRS